MIQWFARSYIIVFFLLQMTIYGSFFLHILSYSHLSIIVSLNLFGFFLWFFLRLKKPSLQGHGIKSVLPLLCISLIIMIMIFDFFYTFNHYLLLHLLIYFSTLCTLCFLDMFNHYQLIKSIRGIVSFIYISSIVVLVVYILGLHEFLSIDSDFIRKNQESSADKKLLILVLGVGQIFVGGAGFNLGGIEIMKYSSIFKEPLYLLVFIYSWTFLNLAYFNKTVRNFDLVMISVVTIWSGSLTGVVMYLIFLSYFLKSSLSAFSTRNITFIIIASLVIIAYIVPSWELFLRKLTDQDGGSFLSTVYNWSRIFGGSVWEGGSVSLIAKNTDAESVANPISGFFFLVLIFILVSISTVTHVYKEPVRNALLVNLLCVFKDPGHFLFLYNFLFVLLTIYFGEQRLRCEERFART